MEKRLYLYGTKKEGQQFYIVYHLGKYAVVRMLKGEKGMMLYTLRQYKTLSGAERYLREHISGTGFVYGTEEEIKKGEYWKA